jgi:proteasome alpha subunit
MEPFDSDYDYDSTIFTPNGRLLQVEYTRESIKKGSTTVGLKFRDGVILLNYKDVSTKLIEISSIEKISQIDKNLISAYIGLSADARHLIDYCQEIAANYKIWYDEQITIKNLLEEICAYIHLFTTFGGMRPFGLVLLIEGIDSSGIHLYATDPSGAFLDYKAVCKGRKSKIITNYLNKHYNENKTFNQTIKLTIDSI